MFEAYLAEQQPDLAVALGDALRWDRRRRRQEAAPERAVPGPQDHACAIDVSLAEVLYLSTPIHELMGPDLHWERPPTGTYGYVFPDGGIAAYSLEGPLASALALAQQGSSFREWRDRLLGRADKGACAAAEFEEAIRALCLAGVVQLASSPSRGSDILDHALMAQARRTSAGGFSYQDRP